MKAKALVTDANKKFEIKEVSIPDPEHDEVLIKTSYSGVSIGTEFALIRDKISWGQFPICTGYMGTGIVLETGPSAKGIEPGSQVYFRYNKKLSDTNGSPITPAAGVHCSHIITTVGGTHGMSILPESSCMQESSMFVMPAVGYYGVNLSDLSLGETVVVHGCGQIGIGVIAAACMRGCRIIAVDVNEHHLELAKTFGADLLINPKVQNAKDAVDSLQPGGADAVFECTGIPDLIDIAISLCKIEGKFIWQGNYGANKVSFSFLPAHIRKLRMYFPCDDGHSPFRKAVLKHMASGLLPWRKVITHTIEPGEAPEVYERILKNEESFTGITINWN